MRKTLRGIIHCHSRYSYDSMISIRRYLRFAKTKELDFVILTDHDSIAGSQALRTAAARTLPRLEVPIAAEYLTDCGDVIAVFLKSEVNARTLHEFVDEARAQGALLLFPHPFVAHSQVEKIAGLCDRIEVFNARASDTQNIKASELAVTTNKRPYAAADAHLAASLGRAIIEIEDYGDLRTSLLQGEARWISQKSQRWEIVLSQGIKALKKRDSALAWNIIGAVACYPFRTFLNTSGVLARHRTDKERRISAGSDRSIS